MIYAEDMDRLGLAREPATPAAVMLAESRRQHLIEVIARWVPFHLRPLFDELLSGSS